MILHVLLEGLGLGVLLVLVCLFGIRKGAVGMVHLYHEDVQARCVSLGLTTREKIRRNSLLFKACCVPGYIAYVLVCVYVVNGARVCSRQASVSHPARLCGGLLADARHFIRHEPDRPLPRGRLVGRAHESVDHSRYGGFEAVYYRAR